MPIRIWRTTSLHHSSLSAIWHATRWCERIQFEKRNFSWAPTGRRVWPAYGKTSLPENQFEVAELELGISSSWTEGPNVATGSSSGCGRNRNCDGDQKTDEAAAGLNKSIRSFTSPRSGTTL